VDASRDAKPTAGTKSEIAGRLRSIAKIVIIDVAAPLIAYSLLRSAGMSTVTALVLSGVFPALGVAIGVIQHRRLDGITAGLGHHARVGVGGDVVVFQQPEALVIDVDAGSLAVVDGVAAQARVSAVVYGHAGVAVAGDVAVF